MKGTMMDHPLTLAHFVDRVRRYFPAKEVVTRTGEGSVARLGWAEVAGRSVGLAKALLELGVGRGDRVASLAWNTHRHMELYLGVPCSGAVLLTANVRLFPDQIARILNHAGARVLFADPDQHPLLEEIRAELETVERVVVLDDGYEELLASGAGETPAGGAPGAAGARSTADAGLPYLAEDDAAAMCYTSGTTGEPKGVVYSHRALVLHTLGICLPDGFGLGETDTILPAVPMFHANGWGLPYAAAMTGAKLVLPGPRPSAADLADLLAEEGVTFAAGVPTVWMGVLEELRRRPRDTSRLRAIHAGGAPSPPSLIQAYREELDVEILSGWGMTEITPVGLVSRVRSDMEGRSHQELLEVRTRQGTPLPLVEVRVVDPEGKEVPWDGESPGELQVRGPWVVDGYHAAEHDDAFQGGWLRTGDVATVDDRGYVRIVDRMKDLIRSGGEWISSVRLEHALMDHPAVAEAAVVAAPDPRWYERPVAFAVLRQSLEDPPTPGELVDSIRDRFADWWLPDALHLVDEIPKTATGKFDKRALRERLRGA